MLSSANVYKSSYVVQTSKTIEIPDKIILEETEENLVGVIKASANEHEEVLYTNDFSNDDEQNTQPHARHLNRNFSEVENWLNDNIAHENKEESSENKDEQKNLEEPQEVTVELTREELIELYQDEIKQIEKTASEQAYAKAYEDAYNQAYKDAFNKRKGELVQVVKQVEHCLEDLEQANIEYIDSYSEELKFLAIEIAEKLILHKIELDDTVLLKLVNKTMETVKNSSWLDVEICERLADLVEAVRKEIETSNAQSKITISPKPGEIDMCRVNTDKGTVVSDISRQAEKLRSLFKTTN